MLSKTQQHESGLSQHEQNSLSSMSDRLLGKWNGASSGRPPFHLPRGLGQFHERGPHAVAQMIGCAVTALRKPHGQRPGAGS